MRRVLAYCRASTNKQELTLQLDLLQQQGYDELFQEHVSGRRRDRPQFEQLVNRALELASQGYSVDVLVVNDARWARDVVSSLGAIERLEEVGCQIRSIEGGIMSVATPSDFLLTAVKAITAEHFSRNLGVEIKRRYEKKRRDGRPVGNRAAWPYRLSADRNTLEPGPDWVTARALTDRLLEGSSFIKSIQWLHGQGVERSLPWLKKWIHNPVLRGHLAYTEGGLTNAERRRGVTRPQRIIYNQHQPLITESEYRRLTQLCQDRQQLWGANRDRKRYSVPPIVVCGHCHGKCGAYQVPGKALNRYWRCKRHACPGYRPATKEAFIEAAIQEAFAETADALAAEIEQALSDDQPNPRIIELQSELEQLQTLAKNRPTLADAIAEIELELAQLKAAPAQVAAETAERQVIIQQIAALGPDDWAKLQDSERREIYADLVQSVTVLNKEVLNVQLKI